MRRFIPFSCLYTKYKATASRLLDWKQGETASLALPVGNKMPTAPPQLTNWHVTSSLFNLHNGRVSKQISHTVYWLFLLIKISWCQKTGCLVLAWKLSSNSFDSTGLVGAFTSSLSRSFTHSLGLRTGINSYLHWDVVCLLGWTQNGLI